MTLLCCRLLILHCYLLLLLLQTGDHSAEALSTTGNPPLKEKLVLSLPTQVFIEDTDAYGVVYNGNYLKYFERALLASSSNVMVSKVMKQRFKSSPSLGERVIVEAELKDNGGSGEDDNSVWNVFLQGDGEGEDAQIFNSAEVTLSSYSNVRASCIENILENQDKDCICMDNYTCQIFRDEMDYLSSDVSDSNSIAFIPLRIAMNFFERSRSNFIGGPDVLRKMQNEDNVVWVVTSVDDASVVLSDGNAKCGQHIRAYEEVTVKSNVSIKRKGGVLEFQQVLMNSREERLAQAAITIWCLDANTRRPKKAPQWFMDQFQI